MSRADQLARVDQVVGALGLAKSKDTIIGGFFRRGISGGERKRVSIGHELLINPAILMLVRHTAAGAASTASQLLPQAAALLGWRRLQHRLLLLQCKLLTLSHPRVGLTPAGVPLLCCSTAAPLPSPCTACACVAG